MTNINLEMNLENSGISSSVTRRSVNDIIYMLALTIGLIHYMIPETTLDVPTIDFFLKVLMFLLLTVQLVVVVHRYTPTLQLLIVLLFPIVVLIGASTTRWGAVYSLYVLVIGAKDIDFKKILKVYFRVGAFICISVVSLSLAGVIENKGIFFESHGFSESAVIRYCMGYIWPTDFATHVFFILLSYWLLKDGRMTGLRILFFLLISYLVFYYTNAMLGTGCVLLLIFASFFVRLNFKMKSRILKHKIIVCLLRVFWVSYIPFMFFLSVWLTASYDSRDIFWIALNAMMTGRLSISQEALQSEGFAWFGQEFKMMGGETASGLYNYIDSAYLQSFIIYGIIFSCILLLSYIYLCNKAYKAHNYPFLYAVLVAGVSGFIAQHFLQIFMNPLLIALTASNVGFSEKSGSTQKKNN